MAQGIFEQLAWLTNKVKKLCCAIDLLKQSGAGSYRVYTALLTQSGDSVPSTTVGDETLSKGTTYTIVSLETGDNLIPYGAPNNDIGTSFVCNQDVGNWGNPLSTLSFNSGAPVVTVLENTIGNIWFEYGSTGVYYANSDGLFTIGKTWGIADATYEGSTGTPVPVLIDNSGVFGANPLLQVGIRVSGGDFNGDSLLNNTPIEIRVYN